jgi:hypothetical protein
MAQSKAPTFDDRYGDGKTRARRYAAEPAISSPDVDFVMPQPDKKRVPGQNFFVFSYAAPEGARVRCKNIAIKPSGMFNTAEEANDHARIIRDEDPRFDVHVIEPGWVTIPIPEDVKPLIHKEYTDKFMTRVMKGQQQSLMQSKKEMDERVARDRAKAEAELRKKYGPDYVMPKKSEQVKKYEEEQETRTERTEGMKFTQRELVENFAKFIVANKTIKPEAAGEFMRFIEASKIAANAPEGSDSVTVVMPPAQNIPLPSSDTPGASSSSAPADMGQDASHLV